MSAFDDSILGLWWRRTQGHAMYAYLQLVSRTAGWQLEHPEYLQQAKDTGRPILWAIWHGQLMSMLNYGLKFEDTSNIVAVTVGDNRFDILNTLYSWFKADTYAVDMQGNPMQAGRTVLNIIRAMKGGKDSFIAPDGPDGPPFQAKDGVSFLAQKAKAAIVPLGVWTKQSYELRRWDHYQVPFPFAKINVVFGEPIMADPKMDSETLRSIITESLNKARSRAQVLSGVTPWQ